jgi:hypothetical protein
MSQPALIKMGHETTVSQEGQRIIKGALGGVPAGSRASQGAHCLDG